MKLSTSEKEHLQAIMGIIHDAQQYLGSLGIDQWQDGYPDESRIIKDISNTESYIVTNDDNHIMGTAMFSTRADSTYNVIDGEWLTPKNDGYGVIHRMAVGNDYRKHGIAKFIFGEFEQRLKDKRLFSMRVDTHPDNKDMQGLLNKLGYSYCGLISTYYGGKRFAFEKLLK